MTETRVLLKILEGALPMGATGTGALTGEETVDEIVERHPALRPTLIAYGLCTCCSGGLTLRQNAEAHGVSLSAILADLERERAKGP